MHLNPFTQRYLPSVEGFGATARRRVVSASGGVSKHDDIVLGDNSSNITLDLPPAASCPHKLITLKKIGNNAATVTIDPDGAELIDSESEIVLFIRYDSITILSDGTNWQMVSDARFKHAAQIVKSNTQSIPDQTYTLAELNVVSFDTGGLANTTTHRLTAKRGGQYLVLLGARLDLDGAGKFMQIELQKNNTLFKYFQTGGNQGSGNFRLDNSYPAALLAGDFLTIKLYHNLGSPTPTTAAPESPYLSIQEV